MAENKSDNMKSIEISEDQKMDLLEEGLQTLQDKVVNLSFDDPVLKQDTAEGLRENLAFMIEEVCEGDPANGPAQCRELFQHLLNLIKSSKGLDKKHILSKVAHELKIRVFPLLVQKMKANDVDEDTIAIVEKMFEDSKSMFENGEVVGFQGLHETNLPAWFNDAERRNRYTKMLERAVVDPEVEKFRKDTHERALRELRGEEPEEL